MSWLARSITNSLRLIDDDENEDDAQNANADHNYGNDLKSPLKPNSDAVQFDFQSTSSASTASGRGVKDDLSELTKSISRQFWGVTSFLAPPPESAHLETQVSGSNSDELFDPSVDHPDSELFDEDIIAAIRNDFAEITGKFKNGISTLYSNKTVSGITKIASNFLQFGSEEESPLEEYELGSVVGVTEEVVAFARIIAMHPETWLHFPLPDDANFDAFELSDAQHEHALAVERLAPRLAALRMELCPGYMSDGRFWKTYFVLLHPRLNKQDVELLSSPEIVEARAMLTIKRKEKQESDLSVRGTVHSTEEKQALSVPSSAQLESEPLQTSTVEAPSMHASDVQMEKHPVQSTKIDVIDKSTVEKAPVNPTAQQSSSTSSSRFLDDTFEDEVDDWLNEDNSEIAGVSRTSMPIANDDDDVSFSDLEEDERDAPISCKRITSSSDSSSPNSDRPVG